MSVTLWTPKTKEHLFTNFNKVFTIDFLTQAEVVSLAGSLIYVNLFTITYQNLFWGYYYLKIIETVLISIIFL